MKITSENTIQINTLYPKHIQRILNKINSDLVKSAKQQLSGKSKRLSKSVIYKWYIKIIDEKYPKHKDNIDFYVSKKGDSFILHPKNIFTGLMLKGIYEPKSIGKDIFENKQGVWSIEDKQLLFRPKVKSILFTGTLNLNS